MIQSIVVLGLIKQNKTQCVLLSDEGQLYHTVKYAYRYYLNVGLAIFDT